MEGDAEAIAIRDAWQFQTSRATRLVAIPADDPLWTHVVTFEGSAGGGGARPVDPCFTSKVTESKAVIKARLNASYAAYKGGGEAERLFLWDAVHLFARSRTEAYKQNTLRLAGRDNDFVNAFTLHAMERVFAKKFSGKSPFGNWLETVYRNFANDSLNDFSKERRTEVGYSEGDFEGDSEAEGGYAQPKFANSAADVSGSGEERLGWKVDAKLRSMGAADQAYAVFLRQGMTQKKAARKAGISVVTGRVVEERLRRGLATFQTGVEVGQ